MLRGVVLAALVLGATVLEAAERPRFSPFFLRWDDGSAGPTSAAAWNERPAGGRGFVQVRDGHFYLGEERIRFWGVNVSFAGGTPDKSAAEPVARRLAKFGVNIVRFHHLDNRSPRGILAAQGPDTRRLDPQQLDRMDYFISQLKAQGIYVNLNLHVSHKRTEADGVRDARLLPKYGKYVSIFDPTLRRLMKEYARQLLTHLNPYTGRAYTQEPAVAMIEITNENSLLAGWLRGRIDDLPPYYADQLQRLWSGWLKERYRSTDRLRAAWSTGLEPLGEEMLRGGDFRTEPSEHWQYEAHEGAEVEVRYQPGRGEEPPAAVLRVVRPSPAGAAWHVQFKQVGLKFEAGRLYTLRLRARADRARPLVVSVMQNHEPWQGLGLRRALSLNRQWKEFRLSFRAAEDESEDARLTFSLGLAEGTVQLAGVSLRPGIEVLSAEESLERGTVRPPERGPGVPEGRYTDYVRFLNDLEVDFFTDMRDFIKVTLGARAPVTGTVGYGPAGIAVQARMDFVDAHAYWQHPRFPRRPWSRTDWYVPNRSMADSPGESTILRLALGRVLGKPFTVTEYNHPAPNEFRAEAIPLIAAYGALQDWDAVFLYSYHHATGEWDRRYIAQYFDIDSDPGKMVQMPVGAAIFRRGDVSPARGEVVLRMSRESARAATARWGLNPVEGLRAAGYDPLTPLRSRVALAFDEAAKGIEVKPPSGPAEGPLLSDTGELRWEVEPDRGGLVTVDTPRTKAVVGRLGGRTVRLDGLTVHMLETDTNFAALTLTAMDDKPLLRSSRILITAVGRVENTGMVWNPEHTSVSDKWGTAPTIAEAISARITLKTSLPGLRLRPLDDRGQPREGKSVTVGPEGATFSIGPEQRTLWYVLTAP